jgi:hypothetical protein
VNGGSERVRFWKYCAVFGVEILLFEILWLPLSMSLNAFGFCDWGANLTVQYLISHGYRPAVDFGYLYGLLSVFAGQVWLGLLGNTPDAYEAWVTVCNLLIAVALARIAARLRFGPFAIAIMVVGIGYGVQETYPNFAHALEALLICTALAEQTLGNRPKALMLSSAAVLAKPSMGYFYSLFLLILIASELRGRSSDRIRAFARALIPTTILFAALVILLVLDFGLIPFAHTVLPLTGMKVYRNRHFGFFTGTGSRFWYDPTKSWFYYFGTVAGFWIFETVYLLAAAIASVRRRLTGSELSARDELIITCALLHVTFVTLFFGNRWSWGYYSYLPLIGVAAAVDIGPAYRRLAAALVMVAVISWIPPGFFFKELWTTHIRSAATAGLWASPGQAKEWVRALDSVRGKRAVVLESRGAADLLFPGFGRPTGLYLVPGLTLPAEMQRRFDQIASAELLVVPLGDPPCYGTPRVPRIHALLKNFAPLWKGKFFEVLQNRSDRVGPGHGERARRIDDGLQAGVCAGGRHLERRCLRFLARQRRRDQSCSVSARSFSPMIMAPSAAECLTG